MHNTLAASAALCWEGAAELAVLQAFDFDSPAAAATFCPHNMSGSEER